MRFVSRIAILSALLAFAAPVFAQETTAPIATTVIADSPFVAKPYLQMGSPTAKDATKCLSLLWHTADTDAPWTVEVKRKDKWVPLSAAPAFQSVRVVSVEPHRVYTAELSDLPAGVATAYRVLHGGKSVFEGTAMPPKAPGKKSRIVVFGDCAVNSAEQKQIAYQTYRAKPDYVFITGDIVYSRGRVSEYREKYFPVYNADAASPETGAPLTRNTVFLASPGNHDIGSTDFEKYPDTMAYFMYWKQPLNGPIGDATNPNVKAFTGNPDAQKAFLSAAGSAYPRMANFSFDYGDVHWTVLDANPNVNWNDPALREWVRNDLKAASKAKWRFVGFHQPGFNSSEKHFNEQQMRVVSDLFEAGKVDLVFNGHVHNYQRSFPMRFAVASGQPSNGKPVAGTWMLDKTFDGAKNTKANGVIYVVTGAGGAGLYNPEQQTKPETWQGFTDKFVSQTHSLTVIDVDGKRLVVKQVGKDGAVLDTFTLTK